MRGYRIPDWRGNRASNWVGYEPPANTLRTERGLPWVRVPVKAPSISQAYLDLIASAPRPDLGLAAFGLFVRCVEMVASRPRDQRDGTIPGRDGGPASVAYIARVAQIDEPMAQQLLDTLLAAGWLVSVDVPVGPSHHNGVEPDRKPHGTHPPSATPRGGDGAIPATRERGGCVVGATSRRDADHARGTTPEAPRQKAEAEGEGEGKTEAEAMEDARGAAAGLRGRTVAAAELAHVGESVLALTGLMTELGIAMPTRAELASLWAPVDDAERRIRAINLEYGNRGRGKGLLVNELRAVGQAERVKRRQAVLRWLRELSGREPEAVGAALAVAVEKLPVTLRERARRLGVEGEAIWPELIAELRRRGWRRVGSLDRTVAGGERLEPVER